MERTKDKPDDTDGDVGMELEMEMEAKSSIKVLWCFDFVELAMSERGNSNWKLAATRDGSVLQRARSDLLFYIDS